MSERERERVGDERYVMWVHVREVSVAARGVCSIFYLFQSFGRRLKGRGARRGTYSLTPLPYLCQRDQG